MVALVAALIIVRSIDHLTRERVGEIAHSTAVAVARVGVGPHLDGGGGAALRRALSEPVTLDDVAAEVTVWDADGDTVYPPAAGEPASASDLTRALSGEEVITTDLEVGGNELVVATVPVDDEAGVGSDGAVQVSAPFDAVAQSAATGLRALQPVALGLVALAYLGMTALALRAERKLRDQVALREHQALHDVLTGLANRALFLDRLRYAIAVAEREGHLVAVMLMDLDRFKEVNDTLGHHKGDQLLRQVAGRLQQTLRETDTIARLGGDEFAVLLPNVQDPAAAINVAMKLREALTTPFVVESMMLEVSASVGVSLFPGHGKDADLLIQRADVAMYLAKAAHTGCEVYAVERDQYSPSRLALVGDMRRALEHDELVLYYQPKVDLRTGTSDTLEALVRWQHPSRGLIPPSDFIPLAEHSGLIERITIYVIDRALEQIARWREQGLDVAVAVNMSPRNLLDLHFPERVAELLRKWRVPPGFLQLEITESTLVNDPARALSVLSSLSNMRVHLAIDDFGTGYSSLAQLRRLPVDEIKIDKSFVLNMLNDESDLVIVRSTIDLGRNLGLQVVAEGAENAEIWRRLVMMGCDLAQGFFRSHPMPPEEVPRWMALARPVWPL